LSRKKSAPAKKAPPIKLRWIEQVIDHDWPEKPARLAIVGVAAVLQKYGDPGGGGICPARGTIAATLRIKPQTLDDVLELMIGAGMLAKTGRTRYGTMIYRLCLSGHTSSIDAVPDAVPHAVPLGTHKPPPSTDKGEGGGGTPGADAPAARVAGLNTGDTETIKPLVTIDGEHADQLVTGFIADFKPAYAKRSKNANGRNLEPSHRALRTGIITKLDAGWPCDHLIDRIIADMPDDRKINTLTGIVAHKLSELPNAPDATALAHTIAAEAKRRIDDAERKTEQTAETESIDREARFRRKQAIKAYRRAVAKYRPAIDADKATREMVESLDAEGQDDDDPAAWPLSPLWVEWMHNEIDELRQEHQARQAASEHETTAQAPTVTQGGSR
jgi:hypothetical protein